MSEIEQLRERVAELEALLGLSAIKPARRRFLGLTPTEAELLGVLLSRPFVSKAVAYEALFGDRQECEQPGEKVIDVYIHRLRKYLRTYRLTIDTVHAKGWCIPGEDQQRAREIFGIAESRA